MMQSKINILPLLAARSDLVALKRLGLTDQELEILALQGFISQEERGGTTVYRLRYRQQGRQKTRYVRSENVAAIAAELCLLQKPVRQRRGLAKIVRLARKKLREHNARRKPILEARGYHLHGHQVRRRRNAKPNYFSKL